MASTDLSTDWGRRLRQMREERGLSRNAVATRASIDISWYARIERGEYGSRGVGDDVRMRIASALDCRVEEIFIYPDPTTTETACSAASATDAAPSPTPGSRPSATATRPAHPSSATSATDAADSTSGGVPNE